MPLSNMNRICVSGWLCSLCRHNVCYMSHRLCVCFFARQLWLMPCATAYQVIGQKEYESMCGVMCDAATTRAFRCLLLPPIHTYRNIEELFNNNNITNYRSLHAAATVKAKIANLTVNQKDSSIDRRIEAQFTFAIEISRKFKSKCWKVAFGKSVCVCFVCFIRNC